MMMPANYSAIAENEMTYVVGGGLIEWAGENLPEIIHNTKTLTTNIVNIIANGYVEKFVDATIGQLFSGKYAWGNVGTALNGVIAGQDGLNIGLTVIGGLASIYQLATVNVKTVTANNTFLG